MNKTQVKDIMSSPVEVLQVGDSLDLAQHLMKAGRIRHLPVIDGDERLGCLPVVAGGKLAGIVTEADFVRFARKLLEHEGD